MQYTLQPQQQMAPACRVALEKALPPHSKWAGGPINGIKGQLIGEETRAVAKAVAKRRQEFLAGRVYAREALLALGYPAAAIPVGNSRQPVWPDGVTGSITHQDDFCVAAVIKLEQVRLIGIDLATSEILRPELIGRICNPPEIDFLRAMEKTPFDPFKLAFSLKESLFKCLYPEVGHYFGFHAVSVFPDFARHTARIEINDASLLPKTGKQADIQAEFTRLGDYIFTVAWVR